MAAMVGPQGKRAEPDVQHRADLRRVSGELEKLGGESRMIIRWLAPPGGPSRLMKGLQNCSLLRL
jgi:hypothetical protein